MRKYGLLGAITLLLIVNAFVFAGILINRSGSPEAAIELTERELPLAYTRDENTGISLSLKYDYDREWLDKKKLIAIGFDCSVPEGSPEADIFYRHVLPHKTYAVFEYDGETWKRWIEKQEKLIADLEKKIRQGKSDKEELGRLQTRFKRDIKTRTRLFPIDADNDPVALRNRYPDNSRFIILPVVVRMNYYFTSYENKKSPKKIIGFLTDVLVDSIHVPLGKRSLLEPLRYKEKREYYTEKITEPRYVVKLHFGKRYEPWVVDVRQIKNSKN
ncbi:MAG: DUF4824 family protein [Nitrospiraceae bacterium]|nr:DUF4824 family protein [Nitrospiraceae bacterium]